MYACLSLPKVYKSHVSLIAMLSFPFQVRWVVEAANERIKRWKYLDRVLPTSQVPYISDIVRIVCAVCNKYLTPINATKDREEDQALARQMINCASQVNELQHYVEENALGRRSVAKWNNVEDCSITDFPQLDDASLRSLTFGTYQLKMRQLHSGVCWRRVLCAAIQRE